MADPFLLSMAKMADDCYSDPPGISLIGEWSLYDRLADDNFLARCYVRDRGKLAVVAIRGSANWKDWVIADAGGIGLSLNALALKLNSAVDFTTKMDRMYQNVWLTGHSLGGAYVQLLSSICDVPGMTFNAPGVVNLVNQMSSNPVVGMVGGLGGGVLSGASLGLMNYFNKAAAALEDKAFASVLNYRGEWDPVSQVGVHVGAPVQTIAVDSTSPHPHSMEPIIRTLSKRAA